MKLDSSQLETKARGGHRSGVKDTVFDRGVTLAHSPWYQANDRPNTGLFFHRDSRDRAAPSSIVTARLMGDPSPARSALGHACDG